MTNNRISFIVAFLYLFLAGAIFASELYKRIYDRGNSEMAGLATYLLTMPSSSIIDRIAESVFGIKNGGSDAGFIIIAALSAIMNSIFVYLIIMALLGLLRRTAEIK